MFFCFMFFLRKAHDLWIIKSANFWRTWGLLHSVNGFLDIFLRWSTLWKCLSVYSSSGHRSFLDWGCYSFFLSDDSFFHFGDGSDGSSGWLFSLFWNIGFSRNGLMVFLVMFLLCFFFQSVSCWGNHFGNGINSWFTLLVHVVFVFLHHLLWSFTLCFWFLDFDVFGILNFVFFFNFFLLNFFVFRFFFGLCFFFSFLRDFRLYRFGLRIWFFWFWFFLNRSLFFF